MEDNHLIDRILGVLFGHALGDAVGLSVRGMEKKDIDKIVFPYEESVRSFPLCDWTENTDTMILIMQSMTEYEVAFNAQDIAQRIKKWTKSGFEELGDNCGLECSKMVSALISSPDYEKDPVKESLNFWEKSNKTFATSSSLSRVSIAGVLPPEIMLDWAVNISLLTNVDSRCVSSCVLQTSIIHNLIHSELSDPSQIDNLLQNCAESCKKFAKDTTELSECTRKAYMGAIGDLMLDDSRAGFVLKSLSCSIYALQVIKIALKHGKKPSFKKFITKIVSEGGESHCNAAVAGAVMGAYLGYAALPNDWLSALPNRDWFTSLVAEFTQLILDPQ